MVVPVLGSEALVEELGELPRLDQLLHVLTHATDHFALDPATVNIIGHEHEVRALRKWNATASDSQESE